MARIGINVDLAGRHSSQWVKTFRASAARIVLTQQHDLRRLFAEYQQAGIFVLGVYARESMAGFANHEEALEAYADRYDAVFHPFQPRMLHPFQPPVLGAIQVGNEADHESPSSWTLSPRELSDLGRVAREAFPDSTLVCSGMTSGNPAYLDAVDLDSFDALAVHPYAKDLTRHNDLPDADVLCKAYQDRFGMPVWVTEWGWWGDEASGEQAVRDMIAWASATDEIEHYYHFCADDVMVPPFGLLREDGTWKPAARAFYEVMWEGVPVPPAPDPVAPEPWIGDGLRQKLDELGWTPTSGEIRPNFPLVHATSPTGIPSVIIWDEDEGRAKAYRGVDR